MSNMPISQLSVDSLIFEAVQRCYRNSVVDLVRTCAQAWQAVLVEVVERCALSALRGSDPGRTSDGRQPPLFGTAARWRR